MSTLWGRKRHTPAPMEEARSAHYWLPFQAAAIALGMTRDDWDKTLPQLRVSPATGSPIQDLLFAARIAGVQLTATATGWAHGSEDREEPE